MGASVIVNYNIRCESVQANSIIRFLLKYLRTQLVPPQPPHACSRLNHLRQLPNQLLCSRSCRSWRERLRMTVCSPGTLSPASSLENFLCLDCRPHSWVWLLSPCLIRPRPPLQPWSGPFPPVHPFTLSSSNMLTSLPQGLCASPPSHLEGSDSTKWLLSPLEIS